MDKVPAEYRYRDVSDYVRPLALWLVRGLIHTSVTPLQITVVYVVAGGAAALLLAQGTYAAQAAAGTLLLVKNWLDAADGALARTRQRPSRVGRFADTLGDLLTNALVYAGIVLGERARTGEFSLPLLALALAAFASMTWQATIYNYFGVLYRTRHHGDTTSKLDESTDELYAGDNPQLLRVLMSLYAFFYRWQDRLILRLERKIRGAAAEARIDRAFMTATTVMGLGIQLLIIVVAAFLGQPVLAFWVFVLPMNLYWIWLLWVYRRSSRGE